MFQERMRAKGLVSIMSVVIIILFSPLAEATAVVVVDSDTDHQKPTLDWDDEPMDHDTAELLWVNCGVEMGYSMEDFQDPHVKKTILDCLRDKRVVLTKSRKDKLTRKWYVEYLVSFIHKPNDPSGRRRLGETVSQGTVIVVVVITAVVTLCVAGLLFYCYIRNFGVAGTQNDEKTLLRSSMGKNSTGGGSKKSEGKGGNIEEQMDAQVNVDTGPHVKAALDPNMHPQAGRVQSSLRHTLKPRAARAESSLRPTRKMEISVRPSGGKTDSHVEGAESSPLQPPVNVGVSPVSSPAAAAATTTAAPISPAIVPQTLSPVAAAPSTPNPPPQVATPPPPAPQTATQPPPVSQTATQPTPMPQTATQPPPVSQTAAQPTPVPQTATNSSNLAKNGSNLEEEMKLRLYGGDLSRLGPAERFLKALVEIPFAFKRLESLLFMCTLQDEEENIKESFETLELVGPTPLLLRGEGIRAVQAAKEGNKTIPNIETKDLDPSNPETEEHYCRLGLEVVSGLSDELENVTKAAIIDADSLTSSVSKLGSGLIKARESLNTDMKNLELQSDDAEGDEFWMILTAFVETAEKDVTWMQEEEKRIMALIKSTADYFHGNCGKDEGLRLFTVVRDFLIILEKVVKEVQAAPIKPPKKKDLSGIDQKDVDLQLDQAASGDTMPPLPPIPTRTAE
ncbi:uncharacterized protein LOC143595764 [Bidens hawaiensis]|uniref:uncharacterized protein LOC143595764 n=1 Tax=Bidens hawaiensis TaxID=980011 RepID=UPI004049320C